MSPNLQVFQTVLAFASIRLCVLGKWRGLIRDDQDPLLAQLLTEMALPMVIFPRLAPLIGLGPSRDLPSGVPWNKLKARDLLLLNELCCRWLRRTGGRAARLKGDRHEPHVVL
jgi:hypothetical protein